MPTNLNHGEQSPPSYVLVTGATGFIGAHIVDTLLARGLRVRGATRSAAKGRAMLGARPQFTHQLDFITIDDFSSGTNIFTPAAFENGVDAVIHVASPFTYATTDNEAELIIPAINGVKSLLLAATATVPNIKRIVLTSSFAAVLDAARQSPPYFTYTAADWNPLTYAEAAAPSTSAVIAYRGSKKFAELAAWDFIHDTNAPQPGFDLVTLCPPMTFGPVVHPVPDGVTGLNESNSMLWGIAAGKRPLPVARVPFWIDVRDLAVAHVEALVRPAVGGRRFVLAAPERFSYALAAGIMVAEFGEVQVVDESCGVDGETAARELGFVYRRFRDTVVDLVAQGFEMEREI
ncbi:NAD dependent epimerase/dehydratase [Podospora appendiculata]|uniref:NAD dependent epimerase/dehydratase n=1 Tax=Podospora appendiculata TaxID=314037 RepID=A0AAE1CB38_9PEZI|nr:NAD dependent epimerase/dehydratase [Podospora appendiculata]